MTTALVAATAHVETASENRKSPPRTTEHLAHHHQDEHDRIMRIELIDTLSHTQCVRINVSAHDLLMALTSMANLPCDFQWRPECVGKTLEHKTEVVFIPDYARYEDRKENAKKALAEYETKGWIGSTENATNHYKWDNSKPERKGGKYYLVSFRRWVDAPEEKL